MKSRADSDSSVASNANGLFLYLCEYLKSAQFRLLDNIAKKQNDILLVLSFCFLGEMTLLAPIVSQGEVRLLTLPFIVVSLVFWIIAFLMSVSEWHSSYGYINVPDADNGFDFLPSFDDDEAYMDPNNEYSVNEADWFMAKLYLDRLAKNKGVDFGFKLEGPTNYYGVYVKESERKRRQDAVMGEYRRQIGNIDALSDFNRNFWLSQLTHSLYCSFKRKSQFDRKVRTIEKLLAGNLITLFIAIVFCFVA